MNKELMESMNILEKEYNISKDTLLEAIENSLLTACKNHFGKADNVKVIIDPDILYIWKKRSLRLWRTRSHRSASPTQE